MAGKDNLKSLADRSTEDQRRIQSMGGKAGSLARKRKKNFKELASLMMDCKPTNEQIQQLKEIFPDLPIQEVTNRTLMIGAQMQKAYEGDTKAFETLRDTAGEAPIKRNEHEHNGKIELPIINVNYTKAPPKTIEGEVLEEKEEN